MYNWVPGDWCLRLPMSYDFTMYSHNHVTRHFDTSPLGWKQPVQPAIFPTFVGKALTLLVAVPMYLVYSEIPIVVSFNSILFFSSQILVIHLDFAVSPVCWLDCFLFEAWSAAMDFGIKKIRPIPFSPVESRILRFKSIVFPCFSFKSQSLLLKNGDFWLQRRWWRTIPIAAGTSWSTWRNAAVIPTTWPAPQTKTRCSSDWWDIISIVI